MTTSLNSVVAVMIASDVKLAKAAIDGHYDVCDHSRKNGLFTITKKYENKNRISVEKYVAELTKLLKAQGFTVELVEASDSWETIHKGGEKSVKSSWKVQMTMTAPVRPEPVSAPEATTDATVDTGTEVVAVQVDAIVDAETPAVVAEETKTEDAVVA